MAKRICNITVDLQSKSYQEIVLKQLDTTELIFTILNGNVVLNPDGLTAKIYFVKPNGTLVQQSATISDSKVVAALNMDCVRQAGEGKVEVELSENDEVVSSFQIRAKIEKSGKGNVTSENSKCYFEEIEDLVNEIQEKLDNGDFIGPKGDTGEVSLAELNALEERVEKVHNITKVSVSTEIQEETDYTLPVNYIVGSGDLVLFYNNEFLIPEENYTEVGEEASVSNKVQFGWNVEAGSILTIIVKGVVEDEEDETE